jgi:hypothetical protein
MPNLIQRLTSISAQSRSGSPPGRRLLALALCAMLVVGSVFPGFAVAGEADSEGEGTTPPIEVPLVPPDFDPGGEETGLEEEAPPSGEEEGGAVEVEAEVEAPASEEVTGAAAEAPVEAAPPPPAIPTPEPEPAAPAPEPVQQQQANDPVEPVANQSITAPKQERAESSAASEVASSSEEVPLEPTQQEAPAPSPQPVAATAADPARSLAGKDSYVVRPGDCLWHIAAGLLPAGADTQAIAGEVARLWSLNEDRIGTGDPSLIYAGTELRLR